MRRIVSFGLALVVASTLFAQEGPESEELLRGYGSLAFTDERYAGGFADVWEAVAPVDGSVSIVVVSPDFVPGLVVEAGGRAREAGAAGRVATTTLPVGQGEPVRITVYNADPLRPDDRVRADYLVVARYDGGSGAGGNEVGRLSIGSRVDGSLDSSDGSGPDGSYVDRYDLIVPRGEPVRVDLSSSDFDTYLLVELPDGRIIENDDTMGTDSSVTFTSDTAGVAGVEVTSFGYGSSGDYRLSVDTFERRDIRVGQRLRGTLEGPGDEYVLTGDPGEAVTIDLESDAFDTYLELTDSEGAYLSNDDAGGTSRSRIVYEVGRSGEATITVSSFSGGGGGYLLAVERYSYDGPRIPDGYRLEGDEVVTGALGPHVAVTDGSYRQRFTFVVSSGERVETVLRSDDFDSYLTVVTPGGTELNDDDSAGGLDSRIVLTAEEAGVYEIYATGLGGDALGEYTLTFTRLAPARLLLDTAGDLSRNDPIDISGKYYDTFRFTIRAGRLVTVDVQSDDFDAYAIVRSLSGEVLYRDDDSAGNSNSRVTFTAERDDTLELVVTTFSEASTGSYRVSIYE